MSLAPPPTTAAGRSRGANTLSSLAPRTMRWRGLLFCFTVLVLPIVPIANAQTTGTDGKDVPEKGDVQCLSLAEKVNSGDTTEWLTPCEGESATTGIEVQVPSNGIVLEFFATLPAFTTDLGTPFAWIVVSYLNEASLNYNIQLVPVINFFNSSDGYVPSMGYEAEIEHHYVIPENIRKLDSHWWWSYKLIFHCFYGEAAAAVDRSKVVGAPIVDAAELRRIEQDLNLYLRQAIDMIAAFDLLELSHGVLGVSVGDPRLATIPFVDGPPTLAPTTSPTTTTSTRWNASVPTLSPSEEEGYRPNVIDTNGDGIGDTPTIFGGGGDGINEATFHSPIIVQYWDWRRYVGLTLFLSTLCGTVFLTLLATQRQRRRNINDMWGNLGTEEGVDALLNTGWKVHGCKMEVYDKKGWGYTDDDSVFLGGYEQRHVGAEITLTKHEYDATTTTNNNKMGANNSKTASGTMPESVTTPESNTTPETATTPESPHQHPW